MKIFVKYVKNFDVLMVTFNDAKVTSTKRVKNIELIYNENDLIGANIFSPEIDKEREYSLEDLRLINYVKKTLKTFIDLNKLEPQFVVIQVKKVEPIQGTHLSLCEVFDGKNNLQIVCGANNVRVDMKSCLATVGSFLPNGMLISKSKLKGFDSYGMLCSSRELNIKDPNFQTPGIMDIRVDDKFIGKSVWEVLK